MCFFARSPPFSPVIFFWTCCFLSLSKIAALRWALGPALAQVKTTGIVVAEGPAIPRSQRDHGAAAKQRQFFKVKNYSGPLTVAVPWEVVR